MLRLTATHYKTMYVLLAAYQYSGLQLPFITN